ncbi:hypothetical protein LBMAG53_16750 [Planctomycetota bacterium]|nr:hypothetical protein LBMAG53_16750 [Planctomycetota bacterium]
MSRFPLSRRGFLRAAGITLALPWLEAFDGAKGAAPPPARCVFTFVPNGVNMWEWHPTAAGADYELTPPLKALSAVRERLTVFSGMRHLKCAGGHGEMALWLTGNPEHGGEKGAVRPNTQSIDQRIASAIGGATRFPSLVVGSMGGIITISFNQDGKPVMSEHNLTTIFNDLMGLDGAGRLAHRASILDAVAGQAATLRRDLGRTDERKVDEFLDSVRSVERRVQSDLAWKDAPKPTIDRDQLALSSDPYKGKESTAYADTMFDLIVLALRMDQTRVVSFCTTCSEGPGALKDLPGGPRNWHGTGHGTGDETPDKKPKEFAVLSEYDAWWAERLARFLGKLGEVNEGDGDLLHRTAVLFGSGMSWPASHRNDNLPLILAGGERLGFKQGRHVVFNGQPKPVPTNPDTVKIAPLPKDAVSMSCLLRTIAERMGVPAEGFGESRRVLSELLA